NWGWCRQQGRDRGELPLIRESMALWDGMAAETGTDVGFRRTGLAFVSDDAAEIAGWERWAADAAPHGIISELRRGEALASLLPGMARQWRAGLYTASDGRAEPSLAAPAIAGAARRHGATLHQGCAARGLETQAGRVAGVVTERGTIRTQAVLCAGGAWSTLFCRRHGIRLPQVSVLASVFRTGPAPEAVGIGLATPGYCMRRDRDGACVVAMRSDAVLPVTADVLRFAWPFLPMARQGWRYLRLRLDAASFASLLQRSHWRLDAPSPFEAVRVLDPAPHAPTLATALAQLRAAHPQLAGVEVAASWGGMIDHTPDAVPVIGPVDRLPGLFIATGFSGHGFGIGPGAGHLAADLISGDGPLVDPRPFRFSRMHDGTRLVPDSGL
ncbi:MAG: FAD-binding oxidoreductase, partial [Rhodospirillales bacterium]|nr:FAD-binding oxidoreductase [Rhodospirillales bacterium]